MKQTKNITEHLIPCWYELKWRDSGVFAKDPSIIVAVHNDFIRLTKPISENAPIVKHFMSEFGFGRFDNSFDHHFGFNGAFRRTGQDGDFVSFIVQIPKIKKNTDKPCQHCNGIGRIKFADLDRKCSRCDDAGKEYFYDWQAIYEICATFFVFFL